MQFLIRRWLHERGVHRFCREVQRVVGTEPLLVSYTLPDGTLFDPDVDGVYGPIVERWHA